MRRFVLKILEQEILVTEAHMFTFCYLILKYKILYCHNYSQFVIHAVLRTGSRYFGKV